MIEVPIPAELESFVQGVVENGSYRSPAEVVGEALRPSCAARAASP